MAREWLLAARARNDFADMIEGLSPEQLRAPTLCGEWTPDDVTSHLVGFVNLGLPSFMLRLAKKRFDFDKASVAMAAEQSESSLADRLAALRSKASQASGLPGFPEELTVSDVVIHTQDVRRPLGLDGAIPDDLLRLVLDFLTTHKHSKTLAGPTVLEGISLEATDLDWSFGSGKTIAGTAEALVMAMAKRPSALDDLTGDGVSAWR